MSTRAVLIVCARAPRRLPVVPATLIGDGFARCSWCGQRVKVVA